MDEIGDMSLSAQAKVLRALQENKITRVGGDKDITYHFMSKVEPTVCDGYIALHGGVKLRWSGADFTPSIQRVDSPNGVHCPSEWGVECIYRINLTVRAARLNAEFVIE